MDSLISALTLSYLLPAAAHIFLFLPYQSVTGCSESNISQYKSYDRLHVLFTFIR